MAGWYRSDQERLAAQRGAPERGDGMEELCEAGGGDGRAGADGDGGSATRTAALAGCGGSTKDMISRRAATRPSVSAWPLVTPCFERD